MDGMVVIGAGYDSVFLPFLQVLGRTDLLEDPRFRTLAARVENRDAVYEVLDAEVGRHRSDELVARLEPAGVPCARVNDMQQVFEHPQVLHRRMLLSLDHPRYGSISTIGPAVKYSGFEIAEGWRAPPLLGEHTDQVYADWLGEADMVQPKGGSV
jgi:succinate--hydroxymethylglutarate CoA-transferase